jgi:hypothetical protein
VELPGPGPRPGVATGAVLLINPLILTSRRLSVLVGVGWRADSAERSYGLVLAQCRCPRDVELRPPPGSPGILFRQ